MNKRFDFYSQFWLFETERLKLRPMSQDDLTQVLNWRNSDKLKKVSENFNHTITYENQKKWFLTSRSERLDYIVTEKKTSSSIGLWSFKKCDLMPFSLEQGRYIGDYAAQGKGYASEIAPLWLYFGFHILEADVIVGVHKIDNIRPQIINSRLGFKFFKNDHDKNLTYMKLTRSKWMIDFQVDPSWTIKNYSPSE
jgi:RimJ/RimL family protein N-acetyltransferase